MLINSIKTLAFKPINFRHKTSPLLNLKTTYCDTFERSSDYAVSNPISFGMASDKVLKNLDEEGKYACSVLGLTNKQVGQYKSIAQTYPNLSPMQIALCAKVKFEDERIEQYATIVSGSIKYIDDSNEEKEWQIPADEAIFCVRENFDDEQLKRYAQLRNRIVDLKDKSVRGTGKTHNLRPQYVLSAVRENKTDEDIKNEERFYVLLNKYGIDKMTILWPSLIQFLDSNISNEDFFAEFDKCAIRSLSETKKIFSKIVEILKKSEDKIPQNLINVHKILLYIFENIDFIIIGNYSLPADLFVELTTGKEWAEYVDLIKGDINLPTINMDLFKKPTSKHKPLKLSNQDESILNLLPQNLKNEIIDGNKTINEVLAEYLPDDVREIFLKIPKDITGEYKHALCKEYIGSKLIVENADKIFDFNNAPDFPEYFTFYRPDDLRRALNFVDQGLNYKQAYSLACFTDITSASPEMLEQLPDNIWYLIQTGENKETHDTIQNAIKLCLNPPIELNEHRVKTQEVKGLKLHSKLNKKGILVHNNSQFAVKLQKTTVNNQPVLIVKDTNSEDKFVAYKGAIAYVAPLSIIDEEKTQQEMKTHSYLLPEKQAQILTRAIREFVFDITDNDGGCIISKGLEGIIPVDSTVKEDDIRTYTGKDKTTKETEEHYLRLIEALDKKNQFYAKNLLRMFPEDAILSINPYAIKTDKSNILYSISAEWKDKEGKHWEMRIHSTDLSDANGATTADKWVFRLGYKVINEGGNNEKHYLRKYKDDNGKFCYDMGGKYKGNDSKDSHIEFISPLEQNNLLNNIDFQKDIRNISAALYGENEINEVCSEIFSPEELKSLQKKSFYEKAGAVIKYAMENPIFYYFKQEYIDKLRAILKLPNLSAI